MIEFAKAGLPKVGGANRNRTDDLLNAIQALSQLSYGPNRVRGFGTAAPEKLPYHQRVNDSHGEKVAEIGLRRLTRAR